MNNMYIYVRTIMSTKVKIKNSDMDITDNKRWYILCIGHAGQAFSTTTVWLTDVLHIM